MSSKKNLIKRKGDFLFFPRKKFFDCCTAFYCEIFGYQSKLISSKIKLFLNKKNKFQQRNNKNYLNTLLKKFPSLNDYHYTCLNDRDFFYFISQNSYGNFYHESIENKKMKLLQKFTSHQKESQQQFKNQNNNQEQNKWNIYTDIYCLFHPDENYQKEGKENKNLLLVETTFPRFEFFDLHHFNAVIITGNHPFGMGNGHLLFYRSEDFNKDFSKEFLINYPMENLTWQKNVYNAGINHFFYKKDSKTNQTNLKQIQEWIKTIEKLSAVETVIGKDFFYKIFIKDKNLFQSSLNSFATFQENSFFLKNLHFLFDKNYFYLLLPLETPSNLLKNRLKEIEQFLKTEN